MFDKDYTLAGRHAVYAKFLKDDAKLYSTIVDVYMNGAVFGLLYSRRADRDTSSKAEATVFADAFASRRTKCMFLYRLAMLLGSDDSLTAEEKVDRAFRDDADAEHPERLEADLRLFHEYVRGGIDVMYERFVQSGDNRDEYLENAMDFMREFADDLSGASLDERIEKLIR